ncbi:MAG: sodium/calcium exchanger 1 [Geminicoccaceae bacterium]|nr:sodium/calcium exchanger 1 [Geminicoccaceae bacterium]
MRALGFAAALALAGWLSPAPAVAATFLLATGETVEGTIIDATRNTVTIRRALGGMRQIPIGLLQQVQTRTADGQALRGRYHGWVDGRYGVEVGTELLWLEGERVVARTPPAGPTVAAARPPEPALSVSGDSPPEPVLPASAPVVTERAAGAPAASPPELTAERFEPRDFDMASVMGSLPPSKPAPAPEAGPRSVALPQGDLPVLSVTTALEEVGERSGEIVFTIELSRPVDDLLVVIYSSVDGIARSGADYEPLQGILTLPAGATSQEVRTKVIDDADVEGDEDFQLFLATNPDLTRVAEQWTRVTIRDDD